MNHKILCHEWSNLSYLCRCSLCCWGRGILGCCTPPPSSPAHMCTHTCWLSGRLCRVPNTLSCSPRLSTQTHTHRCLQKWKQKSLITHYLAQSLDNKNYNRIYQSFFYDNQTHCFLFLILTLNAIIPADDDWFPTTLSHHCPWVPALRVYRGRYTLGPSSQRGTRRSVGG